MAHHFELRLTTAGRAALADGQNRGLNAIQFTKISIGSGFGPGGAPNDGRAALRNERHSAAATGTTAVAGEIALCGEIATDAAYDVREIGLWGRKGDAGVETLYAYWTDAADKFASAVDGGIVVVAGSLVVNPDGAEIKPAVSASVTIQSQGLLPEWLLPQPHVETAAHRLAAVTAAALKGGTVTVTAGQKLSVSEPVAGGGGFVRAYSTAAWGGGVDLDANATYYLRAQVSTDLATKGSLVLYTQKGASNDEVPISGRGTPNAANGGGFPSTPWDARLARITTGAAASVPTVLAYALDARKAAGVGAWSATADYKSAALAWGSDGDLYIWLQASGPSTVAGPVDPTTDADRSHWRPALKIGGLPEGTPAGDDEMSFRDMSAAGKPDRRVQIKKLPHALAPSGGASVGKKYGLKALADNAYELAQLAALVTFLSAHQSVTANWSQVGEALDVPSGTYDLLAGWEQLNERSVAVRFEARPSGGEWAAVSDAEKFYGNASGFIGGKGRAGWLRKRGEALAEGELRFMVKYFDPSGIGGDRIDEAFLAAIEDAG